MWNILYRISLYHLSPTSYLKEAMVTNIYLPNSPASILNWSNLDNINSKVVLLHLLQYLRIYRWLNYHPRTYVQNVIFSFRPKRDTLTKNFRAIVERKNKKNTKKRYFLLMKLKIYIYHKQFFFKKMKAVKEEK